MDPSGRYDDLVTVSSFVPHYHLAGGVNLPKIIDCVGSDGSRRKQLVKVGARVAVLLLLVFRPLFKGLSLDWCGFDCNTGGRSLGLQLVTSSFPLHLDFH